jgi:hypothetical protein
LRNQWRWPCAINGDDLAQSLEMALRNHWRWPCAITGDDLTQSLEIALCNHRRCACAITGDGLAQSLEMICFKIFWDRPKVAHFGNWQGPIMDLGAVWGGGGRGCTMRCFITCPCHSCGHYPSMDSVHNCDIPLFPKYK